MAMTNTANYAGAAVTPAIGGAVAASLGWPAMLALGTVASLAALLALRGLHEGPADGPTAGQPARCLPATPAQNSRRRS
jgi:MFS family permease